MEKTITLDIREIAEKVCAIAENNLITEYTEEVIYISEEGLEKIAEYLREKLVE